MSECERDAYVDVRLRVHKDEWAVLSGDSSYDQDHRGCWGASSVDCETDPGFVADDLISQVLDMHADSEEP